MATFCEVRSFAFLARFWNHKREAMQNKNAPTLAQDCYVRLVCWWSARASEIGHWTQWPSEEFDHPERKTKIEKMHQLDIHADAMIGDKEGNWCAFTGVCLFLTTPQRISRKNVPVSTELTPSMTLPSITVMLSFESPDIFAVGCASLSTNTPIYPWGRV